MEIQFTNKNENLKKWDDFIATNDLGCHLILSDWLASYKSYGFDYEVAIITENGKILGGYGAVVAKVAFFKFYCVPFGPIVINDRNDVLEKLLQVVPKQAEIYKSCYCQINYPIADAAIGTHYYTNTSETYFQNYKKGQLFKFVYATNGLNWIDFSAFSSAEDVLLSFKSSVRRDIRSSERKELVPKFLTSKEEVEKGYQLCLENAKRAGYQIRDWNGFKETLFNLIEKGTAKFISCYKDDDLKGVILLVKSGNYYTYILGGTKKEKPDLLAGHFLQWQAIQLTFNENLKGYNISLGGSDGVQEFKNSFNNQHILFDNGKYYKILKPILFQLFLSFEKIFKPYKSTIAKLISKVKR